MEPKPDCGFLIKQIADNITKGANYALHSQGITISQLRFLEFLCADDRGRANLKEAERYFGVTQATISGIAARLVRKGLITLQPNPEHHRAKQAVITEKGRAVYEQAMSHRLSTEDQILAPLTEEDAAELRRLLQKIYETTKSF